jgi:hypothetical protein
MSEVRILNGNLEEDGDDIVIRGVLDQATLKYIHFAWYQREQGFNENHIQDIVGAYFEGARLPDITLGMRGQRVTSTKDNSYILRDKVFCIDGGQRLWAAAHALQERPDLKIRLGAKTFLGTNEDAENEMFCKLGTTQKRVSASVLLRNRKKKSAGARILVEMNKQEGFALKDRVTWGQAKSRHELMTGFSLARIVGALHCHKAPTRTAKVYDLAAGLDLLVEAIGEDNLKTNIVRFFEMIDQCWTIRNLSGSSSRPHLRPSFLITLARLMSNYPDFWDGVQRNEFYCPMTLLKKLRKFKLADVLKTSPLISTEVIYELLRKQMGLDPQTEASPFDEAAE